MCTQATQHSTQAHRLRWQSRTLAALLTFVALVGWGSAQGQDSVYIVDLPGNTRIELVWVAGGQFTMGNNNGNDVSHSYEASRPEHSVQLQGYYIGRYEITQAVWRAVMGDNPSRFTALHGSATAYQGSADSLPVEQVSWDDAMRFVTLLSQQTGHRFRLPTEAEWEYAARGGAATHGYSYAGCNRGKLAQYAWYCFNSKGHTWPVGRLQPNELGLYDMAGNVAEWCADWMAPYTPDPQTAPRGPNSGDSRILRGGHFYSTSPTCAVFDRAWYVPTAKNEFYGLRVVMDPDEADD